MTCSLSGGPLGRASRRHRGSQAPIDVQVNPSSKEGEAPRRAQDHFLPTVSSFSLIESSPRLCGREEHLLPESKTEMRVETTPAEALRSSRLLASPVLSDLLGLPRVRQALTADCCNLLASITASSPPGRRDPRTSAARSRRCVASSTRPAPTPGSGLHAAGGEVTPSGPSFRRGAGSSRLDAPSRAGFRRRSRGSAAAGRDRRSWPRRSP